MENKMSEQDELKLLKNEATICVSNVKYLDELVQHYSGLGLNVEPLNYTEQYLLVSSTKPVNFSELRKGVPFEKVAFITPVYGAKGPDTGVRKYLLPEIMVYFTQGILFDEELKAFQEKYGLESGRLRIGGTSYSFKVPRADGEKTSEIIKQILKQERVRAAHPNYLSKFKKI